MPTVTIVSDLFLDLAKSIASARGLPELKLAIIPHPLGGLPPEEVRAKAAKAINAIIGSLTLSGDKPAQT